MCGLFSYWLIFFIECISFMDCKGCVDDWFLNRCSNFLYMEELVIFVNIYDYFVLFWVLYGWGEIYREI